MFGPNDASLVWSQRHMFGPSDASNVRLGDTAHVVFLRRRMKGQVLPCTWTKPAFISENINVVGADLHRHKVNGRKLLGKCGTEGL
jgi:hypothetical protein